jgi:DamX protein
VTQGLDAVVNGVRCFHSTPAIEQRIELLIHLAEFGHQPVLLTGPEGAGKTALLGELLERAPSNWSVAILDGEVAATVEAVAERLAEAWDIGIAAGIDDATSDPVQALAEALAGWARRDRVPLIVLDDADRANDALLVSTLNVVFRIEGRARPRLLLAGEAALEERVRTPPVRDLMQGLPHSLEMPPLEEDEVQAYLAARQESDGLSGVRLPADAIRRLHRETGGRPGPLYDRFVRAVAAVAAAEAEPAQRVAAAPVLGAPQTRKYALVMGLVALAFVGSLLVRGLFWRAEDSPVGEVGSVIEQLALPPLERPAPPPPTVVFSGQSAEDDAAAAASSSGGTAGADVENDRQAAPGEPKPADEATAGSVAAGSPADGPAGDASDAPTDSARVPDDATQAPGVAPVSDPTAPEASTPEASTPEQPPAAVAAPPPPSAGAGPAQAGEASPPPVATPEAPAGDAARVSGSVRGDDLAWLDGLRPNDWVLQVFASDNAAAARAALTRHGIADRARVIATVREGTAWHVVVIGPWPDRASASAALRSLPATLRSQGPFPKRVGDLQKASQRPR